jgi:hypothetical protein
LNVVDLKLESAWLWFQPLIEALSSENLVSKFAFKFNLYRYNVVGHLGGGQWVLARGGAAQVVNPVGHIALESAWCW